MGVSPRRLSGWEPRTFTYYEYDDEGRLLSAVTEREPEFSRTDVEAFIAFAESQRVGHHGQPMDEATSPDANPQNRNRKWKYVPEAWTDFAAQELARAKRDFRDAYGDEALESVVWRVKKVNL